MEACEKLIHKFSTSAAFATVTKYFDGKDFNKS